ncbi:MAG: RHS repeat-associated core domain-containing protein [Planctomycetota bacterium]
MKTITLAMLLIGFLAILAAPVESPAVYHPGLGRFLQRDVLGYVDGMSLYQYVGSSPVVRTDPTGGCANSNARPFTPGIKVVHAPPKVSAFHSAYYAVLWEIPARYRTESGWIVQKVNWTIDVRDCANKSILSWGERRIHDKPYWEAWAFGKGGIVTPLRSDGSHDLFQVPDHPMRSRAKIEAHGEVKAAACYQLPDTFQPNNVLEARGLPSTYIEPPDWNTTPPGARHSLTITWDTCASPPPDTVINTFP